MHTRFICWGNCMQREIQFSDMSNMRCCRVVGQQGMLRVSEACYATSAD
jgi:hypothetical protein